MSVQELNGCLQRVGEKGNGAISVILYFLTPSFVLQERRPLDELRNGNVEEIVLTCSQMGLLFWQADPCLRQTLTNCRRRVDGQTDTNELISFQEKEREISSAINMRGFSKLVTTLSSTVSCKPEDVTIT